MGKALTRKSQRLQVRILPVAPLRPVYGQAGLSGLPQVSWGCLRGADGKNARWAWVVVESVRPSCSTLVKYSQTWGRPLGAASGPTENGGEEQDLGGSACRQPGNPAAGVLGEGHH